MIRTRPIREAAPSAGARIGVGRAAAGGLPLAALAKNRFVRTFRDSKSLRDALASGRIHGAVRGDLDAAAFVREFRRAGWKFQRGVLFECAPNQGVLFGPVGITEGTAAWDRTAFASLAAETLMRAGLATEDPLIAVLSTGRVRDARRSPRIARNLSQTRKVVASLQRRGLDAFMAEVMLEDVIRSADIVVAPDGAAGNLAFRALHLVGGMPSFGALCVGADAALVDTSRARGDFEAPVRLAAYLAARRGALLPA